MVEDAILGERLAGQDLEEPIGGSIAVQLDYRAPFRFDDLLAFYRDRALEGVELVDDASYARTVRLSRADGSVAEGWLRVRNEPSRSSLALEMSDGLEPVLQDVIGRVRRMFDTDGDPDAIAEGLAPLKDAAPSAVVDGVRLPGCFDPFETACRAVLGQQVSVKAANKMAARVVRAHGALVQTGIEGLERAWPSPQEVLNLASIEDALGVLGVIRTRSRVIRDIARMLDEGSLDLGAEAIAAEQMEKLLGIKGVGPWTANYIIMRTLCHSDVFLETDAGIRHALPTMTSQERLAAVEQCRPWRSYAVIALWSSLSL